MRDTEPKIESIDVLLKENLKRPKYQRPYSWTGKNIGELLNDIVSAMGEYEKHKDFSYRLGTIILCNSKNTNEKEIVDGQQRIISLLLIKINIDPSYDCPLLKQVFLDKITQKNIRDNYRYIQDWFAFHNECKADFEKAFREVLKAVVLTVLDVSEAFQLFDSQNTRGKELYPHDLLKAYHLREIRGIPELEQKRVVEKWESHKAVDLQTLFSYYLFAIINWCAKEKVRPFTTDEIDVFKGISESAEYTYAKRALKASPCFQITEPFTSGADFFEMTEHYLDMLSDIRFIFKEEVDNRTLNVIRNILHDKDIPHNMGFQYAESLFYCAVLCYYDRFHNLDSGAVWKLFTWAMMLRVDMQHLGFDSVNKYAIGDGNSTYTNKIAMFAAIVNARRHWEIAALSINVKPDKNGKWQKLYEALHGYSYNNEIKEGNKDGK